MNRRCFLAGTGSGLAALGLPAAALGAVANGRKLIVVFAPGGWDITRVFADSFGNANVDMETFAAPATAGGIAWVSHPERPSVDVFFQNFHGEAVVVNGIMVRSIAHEICTMISLTGTTSGLAPDWPAVIAA